MIAAILVLPGLSPTTPAPTCQVGARTPVILVHGFSSEPAIWTSSPSMRKAIAAIPDNYVETFDYRKNSTDWVNTKEIGQHLAERIACLARSSARGKVVVVAHSMGGLATRYAAAQTVHGVKVADLLGLVVTLGTPNLGSFLMLPGQMSGVASLMRASCDIEKIPALVRPPPNPLCGIIGLSNTSAARAMTPKSKDLDELADWPADLPVKAITGHVTLNFRVGPVPLPIDTQSDLVVGLESARHGAKDEERGGGVFTTACTSNNPRLAFMELPLPNCWHNNEITNAAIQEEVVASISRYIAIKPVADFNWRNATYTTDCAGESPRPLEITLRAGLGATTGEATGEQGFRLGWVNTVVGDLTGDSRPEAAVLLVCEPIPSNFYVWEIQVFSDGPKPMGTLVVPESPDAGYPIPDYIVKEFGIENRRVVVGAMHHGPNECHACGATVHRVHSWRWDGERLNPAE